VKKALISPNELIYDTNGNLLGERIAEVSQNSFPVAPPLYWIDCADEVNSSTYYFDTYTELPELIPVAIEVD
jgi:hypothetical protein